MNSIPAFCCRSFNTYGRPMSTTDTAVCYVPGTCAARKIGTRDRAPPFLDLLTLGAAQTLADAVF